MLRNTLLAVLAVLVVAASSQAAIMLQQTAAPMAGDPDFVNVTLRAVSTAGEVINGVNNPTIVPKGAGRGVHQVWQPLLGATPTRGDQNPLAFNDAWRPYDSYWLFDTTNSLSVGGAFTETNGETGGKQGLPPGTAGPARTGWGNMGFVAPAASKGFTIASGLQGTSVVLGQFVTQINELATVSLGVLDNSGGNTPATIDIGIIPEPATASLIGLAMVGVLGFIRRR